MPIGMLMNESEDTEWESLEERNTNKTHSLFMDDLKLYQEDEESLELVHDTIVQASFDTGARYGVKKCAEVVFRKGVMVKGNGLSIMEDRMKSLDPDNGDYYKFLGLEQANGIDRHQVYKIVKEKVKERMQNIVTYELHDKNLINAINTRVIPVITYGMNVIKYTKEELTSLEMIIKKCLREKKMHSLQGSDERLYLPRKVGGRGLKSVKDAYEETKIRILCYLFCSQNPWLSIVWKREIEKNHISLSKEVSKTFENIDVNISISLDKITIEEAELSQNYKKNNKMLKTIYQKGKIEQRKASYKQKQMQSEIWSMQTLDSFNWLQIALNPEKTSSIIQMCEQMVETRYWKKIRGLQVENDRCRVCGKFVENVQHILAGCEKLAGVEYLKRHNKALSLFAFEVGRLNKVIDEGKKWYDIKWEDNKILENQEIKLMWDFQYHGRKENVNRRPDLTVELKRRKTILLYDMACPMEINIEKKRNEKLSKYRQIAFEIREKRKDHRVEIVPLIIGCCGGGFKNALAAINKTIENEKQSFKITREIQKIIVNESESILRKVLSGLIQA